MATQHHETRSTQESEPIRSYYSVWEEDPNEPDIDDGFRYDVMFDDLKGRSDYLDFALADGTIDQAEYDEATRLLKISRDQLIEEEADFIMAPSREVGFPINYVGEFKTDFIASEDQE